MNTKCGRLYNFRQLEPAVDITATSAKMSSALLASVCASSTAQYCFTSKPTLTRIRQRLPSFRPVASSSKTANQSYPQSVNLDEAKGKAAEIQSQQSKSQGGVTKPTDEASKARVSLQFATILACACTRARTTASRTLRPLETVLLHQAHRL